MMQAGKWLGDSSEQNPDPSQAQLPLSRPFCSLSLLSFPFAMALPPRIRVAFGSSGCIGLIWEPPPQSSKLGSETAIWDFW
jgi:hypothetical protein